MRHEALIYFLQFQVYAVSSDMMYKAGISLNSPPSFFYFILFFGHKGCKVTLLQFPYLLRLDGCSCYLSRSVLF